MRLSYLRYALKTANDPRGLLEQESEELHLSVNFRSLLEPFVPNDCKPRLPLSPCRRRGVATPTRTLKVLTMPCPRRCVKWKT